LVHALQDALLIPKGVGGEDTGGWGEEKGRESREGAANLRLGWSPWSEVVGARIARRAPEDNTGEGTGR